MRHDTPSERVLSFLIHLSRAHTECVQNVRNFVDVANRWRPRVFGALRIAHASMGVRQCVI